MAGVWIHGPNFLLSTHPRPASSTSHPVPLAMTSLQHLQQHNKRQRGFDIVHFDRFTSTPASFYRQFLKRNFSGEAGNVHELELGEGRKAPCDTLLLGAITAFPSERRGTTQQPTPTSHTDLHIKAFLQERYRVRH